MSPSADPTDDNLTAEDLAALAAIEADDPTELLPIQQEYAARGAVLIGSAGDAVHSGVPLGESPDNIAGAVTLTSVGDTGLTEILTLPIDGKADPYLTQALRRHARTAGNLKGAERDAAVVAAFREAAAARTAAGRPAASPPAETKAVPAGVLVRVRLGSGLGHLDVVFRDVVIEGPGLVLIGDPPAPGRPGWVPPVPAPDADPVPLTFEVAGLGNPVRAFPLGISYPYGGAVHYVLLLDRSPE